MTTYTLRCPTCDATVPERPLDFRCPHHDALLRTSYATRELTVRAHPGVWRFHDWLPTQGISPVSAGPTTYRSQGLGPLLGLSNLLIAFNGYWPEKGASTLTGSFKDYEAIVTVQYAKEHEIRPPLVVASAGSTAMAFACVAAVERSPVVLVVPERCVTDLQVPTLDAAWSPLLAVEGGDYSDAIIVAQRLAAVTGCPSAGGAASVARRDALGTVFLDAVTTAGEMPAHYFQAVGSGTGAIAAWEAALRLTADGSHGTRLPHLHLAQNVPFVPMVRAWSARRRALVSEDLSLTEEAFASVCARVLTNRKPPYSVAGGLFEALAATDGEMYAVTNDEAAAAGALFEAHEGIDISPAASVAVASLVQAVRMGRIQPGETTVLNITAGGNQRRLRETSMQSLIPTVGVRPAAPDADLAAAFASLRERIPTDGGRCGAGVQKQDVRPSGRASKCKQPRRQC